MIYIKYLFLVVLDAFANLSNFIAAPILSIFTRARPDLDEAGKPWGWIYGTWDNPPQGDEKWQREGWFPQITTGFKGYLNRIGWLFRNPCYGLQRMIGIDYDVDNVITCIGDEHISDKYARPGYYYAEVKSPEGKLLGFEYYTVRPYGNGKCFRMRLGWKIMTDKFKRYGFATFVDTITPYKQFGDT